jgi:hypothetical protein
MLKLAASSLEPAAESERRIARLRVAFGLEQVVSRHAVVVAGDLVSVARFEEVVEVLEEVMDLDDGLIAEPRQREFAD